MHRWRRKAKGSEGSLKQVLVRQILVLLLNKFFKKGGQLYAGHVSDSTKNKGPSLEDYWLLE